MNYLAMPWSEIQPLLLPIVSAGLAWVGGVLTERNKDRRDTLRGLANDAQAAVHSGLEDLYAVAAGLNRHDFYADQEFYARLAADCRTAMAQLEEFQFLLFQKKNWIDPEIYSEAVECYRHLYYYIVNRAIESQRGAGLPIVLLGSGEQVLDKGLDDAEQYAQRQYQLFRSRFLEFQRIYAHWLRSPLTSLRKIQRARREFRDWCFRKRIRRVYSKNRRLGTAS